MSDEALLTIVVSVVVVVLWLTFNAIRESWTMNRQHQTTVDQQSSQQQEFDQLVDNLRDQPRDADLHNELLAFCRGKGGFGDVAYRSALELVSQTGGDATVKRLAFETGRLSYGPKRRDGKPTVSDELAIEKEIDSRC